MQLTVELRVMNQSKDKWVKLLANIDWEKLTNHYKETILYKAYI